MDARLRYALGDVGGADENVTSNTQRYLVGLKGTNWDWDWDAAFLYIDTKTKLDLTGYVNYPNLLQALNGQGGFGYYQPGVAAVNNNPAIYNFIAPQLELRDGQHHHPSRSERQPRPDADGRWRHGARAGRRLPARVRQ